MLTQNQVKEFLDFNPDTGVFTWKVRRSNLKAGDEAGALTSEGYVSIKLHGRSYQAHRLAWLFMFGAFPVNHIDHINQVRTDNRITNLRDVTQQDNLKNKTKYSNNKSGITGVFWYKYYSKWVVKIKAEGKNKHIGYFLTKDEAMVARDLALIKYGYHPNHGQTPEGINNG